MLRTNEEPQSVYICIYESLKDSSLAYDQSHVHTHAFHGDENFALLSANM